MIRFETENGHHEYWYDAGEVAKFLHIKNPATGRIIGRNLFLELLRYNKVLMKDSTMPTQMWINMGLARFHMVNRRYKMYGMPIFSENAIKYLEARVADGRFAIGFEKRKEKKYNCDVKLEDVC